MPTLTAGMSDPNQYLTTDAGIGGGGGLGTDAFTNMLGGYGGNYGTPATTLSTDFTSSTYAPTPPASSTTDLSGYTGAAYPGADTSGVPNLLSNLFSGGTSGGLGGLGGLLGTAVNYGVPLAMANQAKSENKALAGQLSGQATPLLQSGQQQLADYKNLTPLQQQQLQAGLTAGQTTAGRGQPLIDIGTTAMKDYTAGNLPAWQQKQLDEKVAQQKALARQSLGANVDSTTLAQMDAQIDNQAQIAKGQMMQSNLATGEASYGQGVGYETTGNAAVAQAYQGAVTDVNQNLSNALSTIGAGLGPLESAIQLEIAGNTSITNSLMQMYAAIAKASASGGAGAAGAGGAAGGGLGSLVSGVKNLLGGGGFDAATAAANNISGMNSLLSAGAGALPTTASLGAGAQGLMDSYLGSLPGAQAPGAVAGDILGTDFSGATTSMQDWAASQGWDLTGGGLGAGAGAGDLAGAFGTSLLPAAGVFTPGLEAAISGALGSAATGATTSAAADLAGMSLADWAPGASEAIASSLGGGGAAAGGGGAAGGLGSTALGALAPLAAFYGLYELFGTDDPFSAENQKAQGARSLAEVNAMQVDPSIRAIQAASEQTPYMTGGLSPEIQAALEQTAMGAAGYPG